MKIEALLAFIFLVVCLSDRSSAATQYRITTLGFNDIEHTDGSGRAYARPGDLNDAGQVIGSSIRRNGSSTYFGLSAWLNDGATTKKIGFTGPDHTRSDGYKYSGAGSLNEQGHVVGSSSRFYGGSKDLGSTAWVYDGATTVEIGLTGIEHTRDDGFKTSTPFSINETGQVVGHSDRFNGGSASLGRSVWLYDGAETIEIGLVDPEHTRGNGYRYSWALDMNEAGQVLGIADRYVGDIFGDGTTTTKGRSVWIHKDASTTEIGLTGAEHTSDDGYRYSSWGGSKSLNSVGQAIGYSYRFNGGNSLISRTAWFYDGVSSFEVGLMDPEHTSAGGIRASQSYQLNNAGQVIGHSRLYNGEIGKGQSAWRFDGETAIEIGLTGGEHTSSNGNRYAEAFQLNEAGHVLGRSARYGSNSTLGYSVWLFDGTTSTKIGPTGGDYIRDDGYTSSSAYLMNSSSQVVGTTLRYYAGDEQFAADAWFYDPELDETFVLPFPRRSNGDSWGTVAYLGDDGLVLGYYNVYNSQDDYVGDRAFYFTVEDGLHELGSLVEGGLESDGWHHLAEALRANQSGQIVGHGTLTSEHGSQMAYLLSPVLKLPGDFNGDGSVDATDYTVWRDHLGSTFDLRGNGDETGASAGIVDAADYEFWKAHFGTTSGGGSNSPPESANKAVPEPSAYLPATLGAIGLLTRRRR